MDKLSKLVRSRGVCKRRITEFEKIIDAKLNAYPGNTTMPRVEIIEIKARLQKIEGVLDEFESLQEEIDELGTINDPDYVSDDFQIFEANFYVVVAKAKVFLEGKTMSPPLASLQVDDQKPSHPGNISSDISLPAISLPKFSGQLTKWLEFRDMFQALVHNSAKLSNIQKLYYLRASLMGDASRIISSLESSADNYDIAWNLICERYENKRVLIQNHVKSLFNINTIKKESSVDLRAMFDTISINLRALKSLGQPIEHWDTILIVAFISKLDDITAREWETNTRGRSEFPNLDDFKQFLREKATMLDNLKFNKEDNLSIKNMASENKQKYVSKSFLVSNLSCYYCKAEHTIYNCNNFQQLSVDEKVKEVHRLNLCVNCLRPGHILRDCRSTGCKRCQERHNTLLHKEQIPAKESVALNSNSDHLPCLLPTALVSVMDEQGGIRSNMRALLDTGSQSNFITQETANYLNLQVEPFTVKVSGVNNCKTNIKGRCRVNIRSNNTSFAQEIPCLVIPIITNELPHSEIDVGRLGVPNDLVLADPNFSSPGPIHILLGVGICFEILTGNKIILGSNKPTILETQLGWIVGGDLDYVCAHYAPVYCNVNNTDDIQNQLAKFWDLEECNSRFDERENFCETHFADTFERNDEGRFVVSIPLTKPLNLLGESRSSALKRFLSYERKLSSNSRLRVPYVEFLKEYEALNHMSKISADSSNDVEYFLPHHGVINESSLTTKLRVVFDASNPSSSGYSFNSVQGVGPRIQQDLFMILTRFRQHSIAISADVTKMYRQILVKDEYRCLQKIFWRENPTDTLQVFQLNTVTYGTASAPFLAVRCLHQLAIECTKSNPQAAQVIKEDFYVDDLLSGGETVKEVLRIAGDVSRILDSGGFPLRKWISNSTEVMQALEGTEGLSCLNLGENENTKTLGMHWDTKNDHFVFQISANPSGSVTKRTILSMTGQIFDPLGLLGACTIRAKLLLQSLWQEKVGWDEPISNTLEMEWLNFRNDITTLNSVKIPRCVVDQTCKNLQLHGFADASERAYGACVYILTPDKSTNIIASKSSVAPLKTQTIPRLELCAALLLSNLVEKILVSFRLTFEQIYLWSDSTIVLSWLQKPRNEFKIFVSNRVGQIQDLTQNAQWRYVPSKENPADLVSRGISSNELVNCNMWWQGPSFLAKNPEFWPDNIVQQLENTGQIVDEFRHTSRGCVATIHNACNIVERFSSLIRAKRVVAYCLRFIANCRSEKKKVHQLTPEELSNALKVMVKITQNLHYCEEIKTLKNNGFIKGNSKILALNPFLDNEGILRIGGRLKFSNLNEDQKHSIIIPPKCHLSLLLFRLEHVRLGHAGPLQLLYAVREQFWVIHGRNMAKKVVNKCIVCYRAKPVNVIPIMGSLPSQRVTPSRPFLATGIDYAGPFLIKRHKGRGGKIEKAYLALFVCFCTKAVHLEVVPDLSSDSFLASLKRFIARRGKPNEIYSDNGTNFVGACNELKAVAKMLAEQSDHISNNLANDGIKWHFIPANAPHFGGLWESGIKRAKFHLKRIVGNASLTFEELSTLTCQIESIMNSRPLNPMSNDPQDLEPLTPSHFLIGRRLTSMAEPNYGDTPMNRCSNHQRIQQILQHFWSRWSKEYLPELQTRNKWRINQKESLKINDLVLVREDNTPPLSWPMGRIEELFEGNDGVRRVASVRTRRGILRRSVTKLFPLPIEEDL